MFVRYAKIIVSEKKKKNAVENVSIMCISNMIVEKIT